MLIIEKLFANACQKMFGLRIILAVRQFKIDMDKFFGNLMR